MGSSKGSTRGTGKVRRVRFETPRGPVFISSRAVTSISPHGTAGNSSIITLDGETRFVVQGGPEQVHKALEEEPPEEG